MYDMLGGMIVNETVIPLSEYCNVIGRIERFGDSYSATLSWTGEFFAGEEIIGRVWRTGTYEKALEAIMYMVANLERRIMELGRAVVRFSEGDNKAY